MSTVALVQDQGLDHQGKRLDLHCQGLDLQGQGFDRFSFDVSHYKTTLQGFFAKYAFLFTVCDNVDMLIIS